MPEIPYVDTEFISEVRTLRSRGFAERQDRHVKTAIITALAESYHERVLGGGDECFVMPKKGDATKVLAVNYERIKRRRGLRLFYVHRIFSTLFPHNFPKVHAVFFGDRSGTVRQFVQEVKRRTIVTDDIRYPVARAQKIWEELFGEKFALDTNSHNFLLTEEWEQFFVDRMRLRDDFWTPERIEILMGYMSRNGYSKDDIEYVGRKMDRLNYLKDLPLDE